MKNRIPNQILFFVPILFYSFFSSGNIFAQTSFSFNYIAASTQTWVVPAGVCAVQIKAWGAGAGGGGADCHTGNSAAVGGGGGYATGTVNVSPGDVLTIYVGGKGKGANGNGGGNYTGGSGGWGYGIGGDGGNSGSASGSPSNPAGAGGGGAGGSAVLLQSGAVAIVAGGGGGSGGEGWENSCNGSVAGHGGDGGSGGTIGGFTNSINPGGLAGASATIDGANGTGAGYAGGGGGGGGFHGGAGGTGGAGGSGVTGDGAGGGGGGNNFCGGGAVGCNILDGVGSNPGNSADPDLPPGLGQGGAGSSGDCCPGNPGTNGFVIVYTQNLTAVATATAVPCNGGSNGVANVSLGGGGPYTYLWSPSGGTGAIATGLSAGDYTVAVISSGCSVTQTVTVGQPSLLSSPAVVTATVSCNGGNNGAATANPSGGTSPYTFLWSDGQAVSNAVSLIAGNYSVAITDANGCSVTQTVAITEPTAMSINANEISSVSCNGGSNGSAIAIPTGGTSPYTFLWNNGQATSTPAGLLAGNYSVTVTDASGCTQTQTVTITEPTALSTTAAATASVSCNGGNNGSATVSASGGTPPYIYLWNNAQANSIAAGLTAGNYFCTVTDFNGCALITQTVTITEPTALIATAAATASVSCGGGNNGSASANASGGTSPYSYSWSNGQATQNAAGLAVGTYTVTATDANGCTQIASVTIAGPTGITITITSTASACTPPSGIAVATANGGSSSFTYLWNNGQTSQIATNLAAGTYTVTVTDGNGCPQNQTAVVSQTPGPTAVASASTYSLVLGSTTQLTGTGGGTYTWTPTNGLSCINCASPSAKPSETTDYCVMVTDANGCTDDSCVTINVDIPCGKIYVPNAFSPNDDGENDVFYIYGNCISNFELKIYDRWGEKVFETTNPKQGWDGSDKGIASSSKTGSAVFVYYLKATFTTGETVNKKGNISLVR